MRIALYARVSTTDQSCEMQLRELRDYTASRGWQVLAEYVDTGWSGARASRPQLDRLLRDARARRFDAVLVWKLDRWGRSVADSVRSIQELVALGVRFLAVTQNLDTDETNPMSRFLLHILAAFAELEREMIRERVRAGLQTAKAQGKALGRPRRAFRRDEAVRLRSPGRELAENRPSARSAHVYGNPGLFRKPSAPLGPRPAETRQIPLPQRPFQKHMFSEHLPPAIG